ncbi:hypothetical protein BT96DRAFT_947700 [Gymnopus androsaceus JB14]|uniref:Uncharacterized protein n=1 Tax=Gymnopus androsaceus JB14 TaxID=1447944 RepID=A0A6A4GSE5_9AGAR|nr:hypothetical protein BT96DRAFT_947700 [Gymnopus androsaceus JB14]
MPMYAYLFYLAGVLVNITTGLIFIGGLSRSLIISGASHIFIAALLVILYKVPYAIWGLSIFAGQLNKCNDGSVSGLNKCTSVNGVNGAEGMMQKNLDTTVLGESRGKNSKQILKPLKDRLSSEESASSLATSSSCISLSALRDKVVKLADVRMRGIPRKRVILTWFKLRSLFTVKTDSWCISKIHWIVKTAHHYWFGLAGNLVLDLTVARHVHVY